jgi:hypothetical protein
MPDTRVEEMYRGKFQLSLPLGWTELMHPDYVLTSTVVGKTFVWKKPHHRQTNDDSEHAGAPVEVGASSSSEKQSSRTTREKAGGGGSAVELPPKKLRLPPLPWLVQVTDVTATEALIKIQDEVGDSVSISSQRDFNRSVVVSIDYRREEKKNVTSSGATLLLPSGGLTLAVGAKKMGIRILLHGQALRKWVHCEFRYRFGNRVRNVRFAIGREDLLRIRVSLAEIADRAFVTQVGLVNNHILK